MSDTNEMFDPENDGLTASYTFPPDDDIDMVADTGAALVKLRGDYDTNAQAANLDLVEMILNESGIPRESWGPDVIDWASNKVKKALIAVGIDPRDLELVRALEAGFFDQPPDGVLIGTSDYGDVYAPSETFDDTTMVVVSDAPEAPISFGELKRELEADGSTFKPAKH